MSKEINIIIPMAGDGKRFKIAGYQMPKPFIEVQGKMMIERVLEGIQYKNANYILIIQQSFQKNYQKKLDSLASKYVFQVVAVETHTQGASCTVLASHQLINNRTPIVICDCDNIIDNQVFENFINFSIDQEIDGSLLTFQSSHNCFSYAKLDSSNKVIDIKEKEVISNNAIAGFYYIGKGEDFINSAINIMIYNNRSQNEYYVSNVYNDLLKNNKRIVIRNVDQSFVKCVGTPEQLKEFNEK